MGSGTYGMSAAALPSNAAALFGSRASAVLKSATAAFHRLMQARTRPLNDSACAVSRMAIERPKSSSAFCQFCGWCSVRVFLVDWVNFCYTAVSVVGLVATPQALAPAPAERPPDTARGKLCRLRLHASVLQAVSCTAASLVIVFVKRIAVCAHRGVTIVDGRFNNTYSALLLYLGRCR